MRKAWLIAILGGIIAGSLAIVYVAQAPSTKITGQLNAVAAASGSDDPGWQRVTEPRPFSFPTDHGPHETYQTEWWYYTGNLVADDGHQFGFQLTFFRRGLTPEPQPRASRWATRNVYLAHFAISDLTGKKFYAAEHFSRDGGDLAGAQGNPYHVWLGPWQASGSGPGGMSMQITAQTDETAIDLHLESTKPATLQGDRGYSVKGQGIGNASYYYSLTRMATTGHMTIGGRQFNISAGSSWMDHEWGTSKLDQGAVGWDWFGLQLDDGREITWAQLRQADGSTSTANFGSITADDGKTTYLGPHDLTMEITAHWTSPRSSARYPAGWHLVLPKAGLDIRVTPRLADQELPVSIVYWEGAVAITGTSAVPSGGTRGISGHGYVELTGYQPATQAARLR